MESQSNINVGLGRRVNTRERTFALATISIPFISTLFFIAFFQHFTISACSIVLLVSFYILTALGITIGYHRLLTHRSFKAHRWLKIIFVSLGCMAFQGAPFFWIAAHRRHHKFTDIAGDPHSPNLHESRIKGFFKGHMLWMFNHQLEDWRFYIRDLLADNDLRILNRNYLWIGIVGLIIPAVINGLYDMTWAGFWTGLFMGGLVRVFLLHHVTWSINSVCHVFGFKDYPTKDNSLNNPLFGLLAMGEGWHNNHHAFPFSARHGLKWWQFDISYILILTFKKLGLASDIRLPSKEELTSTS